MDHQRMICWFLFQPEQSFDILHHDLDSVDTILSAMRRWIKINCMADPRRGHGASSPTPEMARGRKVENEVFEIASLI